MQSPSLLDCYVDNERYNYTPMPYLWRVASESPKPNRKTFKKKLKLKVAGERAGHPNFFIFYIQKNENGHCNACPDGTNARVLLY